MFDWFQTCQMRIYPLVIDRYWFCYCLADSMLEIKPHDMLGVKIAETVLFVC